jgi:hypothetical protein
LFWRQGADLPQKILHEGNAKPNDDDRADQAKQIDRSHRHGSLPLAEVRPSLWTICATIVIRPVHHPVNVPRLKVGEVGHAAAAGVAIGNGDSGKENEPQNHF